MGNTQNRARGTCVRFLMNKLFQTKFSRLIAAIKQGNLSLVKSFFKEKVNFNQYLQNGDTPLHIAVKYNKFEIAKFICDHVTHLNLNDKNFVGDTPLMLAVMDGNQKLVEYLILRKFADLDLPENRGFTPFMAACANGNLNLVKFLVKNGCNYRIKSKDGQTGLHRAAFYGNVDVIRYLIKDLKMNVLLPDRKGNIPLHLACMELKITCIRILSRASNKSTRELLHIENKHGVRPIDYLMRALNRIKRYDETINFEDEQIVEYIKDKRNTPTFKRLVGSTHKSLVIERTDIFRPSKKATTFSNHDIILIGDSPLLRREARPMSELDAEVISPRDDKPKVTEEEELIKRTNTETIQDTPLLIPLSGIRGSSFASPDLSPASFTIRTEKRFSTASKLARPILRTTTKFSENSNLSRTITINERDRGSFLSSADDAKAILFHFAPAQQRKSKFAGPAGSSQEALPKDGKGSNVSFSKE